MYKQTSQNNVTITNRPVDSTKTRISNDQHSIDNNAVKVQKTKCIIASSAENNNHPEKANEQQDN